MPDPTSSIDPVKNFNLRKRAVETETARLKKQATLELVRSDPEFIRTAGDAEIEKAIGERVTSMRADLGENAAQGPVTLANTPLLFRDGPVAAAKGAFGPTTGFASRATGTVMGALPESFRPDDLFEATGTQAVRDLATSGSARLDDVGELAQTVAPAAAALIPQLRGAKILGVGPNALSAGGAVLAAGGVGASREILDRAQALMDASGSRMPVLEGLEKGAETTHVEAMVMRGLGESLLETVTAGGAFAPQAAKMGLAKFLGVSSDEATAMVRDAARFKMDLAVRDVTNIGWIRRMSDILGKFPSANKIFVEETDKAALRAAHSMNEVLGSMAPTITEIVNATEGRSASRHALQGNLRAFNRTQAAYTAFGKGASDRYTAFFEAAKRGDTPAVVQPAQGRVTAATERQKLRSRIKVVKEKPSGILDSSGRPQTVKVKEPTRLTGDAKAVDNFLSNIVKADDLPSVEEFVGTTRELSDLIAKVGPNSGLGVHLVKLKKSLEFDFENNLIGDPSVIALKREADDFYKEGIELFSGQAGKRMKRVDRNFGKVSIGDVDEGDILRNGGTRSPSQVIGEMFDSRDPEVVRNLEKILMRGDPQSGRAHFSEAYGIWLEKQFRGATKTLKGGDVPVTDTNQIRKALGLDNISSDAYRASESAFRAGGVEISEFGKFLDVLDRQFEFGIPDVSTLITRRVLIGGIGSGARTFAPLAGKGGGDGLASLLGDVSKSAAFYLASRGISRRIAQPRFLKAYRTLLDPKAGQRARLQAVKRLLVLDSSFLVFDNITGGGANAAVSGAASLANDMISSREGVHFGDAVTTPLPNSR